MAKAKAPAKKTKPAAKAAAKPAKKPAAAAKKPTDKVPAKAEKKPAPPAKKPAPPAKKVAPVKPVAAVKPVAPPKKATPSKAPAAAKAAKAAKAKGDKVLAHMVGVLDHLGGQTTDASLRDELQGAREDLVRTFESITTLAGAGLPAPATAEAVSAEASDENEALPAAAGAAGAVGNDDDEDQDDAASEEDEEDDEPPPIPPRETPLVERRGIVDPYGNDEAIMVLAPVEAVARTFVEMRRAPTWERDAFAREVTLTAACFSILRLRGHRWTTIVPELVRTRAPGVKGLSADEAQDLSRRLDTRALWAAHGETGGYVGYAIFDSGEMVERMVSGEARMSADGDLINDEASKFQSRRRSAEDTKIEDPSAFADAVLVEEDALLLPGGSFRSMGSVGEKRPLGEGLSKGDIERLDYVAQGTA